jgi:hypothetical protein
VDGRRSLTWLEAQMREGGWLPTFPTVRAVFDCLIWLMLALVVDAAVPAEEKRAVLSRQRLSEPSITVSL